MKKLLLLITAFLGLILTSCTENYKNGERIGLVTKFQTSGVIEKWKSYEGELHVTQTGMNSTMNEFDFSLDNDKPDSLLIKTLDSAANRGWKVKLIYHETFGHNWLRNRGETDTFVSKVIVLDRNVSTLFNNNKPGSDTLKTGNHGKVIDTVYVIIVDKSRIKK